jgi:hypothetical protein
MSVSLVRKLGVKLAMRDLPVDGGLSRVACQSDADICRVQTTADADFTAPENDFLFPAHVPDASMAMSCARKLTRQDQRVVPP